MVDRFKSLPTRLLESVHVASPAETKLAQPFGKDNNQYWGEFISKHKGTQSTRMQPTVHINKQRYEKSLGRKVTPKQMRKYALSESLHNLKNVEPETYYNLRVAALRNPDYRNWVMDSYKNHAVPKEGEERDLDEWEQDSRFDQIVSGYVFGGDPDFPSMEDWNAYDMPYSGAFRDELSKLKARMLPKAGVIHPYVENKSPEFY